MKQQKWVDLDQLSLRPQEEGALPPPPPPSSTSSTGAGWGVGWAGTWDLQLRDKLEPLQARARAHTHTHFLVRVWLKPAPRESSFKVARWARGPESP